MTTYYMAQHSTGTVHLRASRNAGAYRFACVGKRQGDASYSSRRELAQRTREHASQWKSDQEVVPVAEIDKAEYNRLLKAGKRSCSATFMGKAFTKSWNADQSAPVVAVGHHDIEHLETPPVTDRAVLVQRIEHLRKYGSAASVAQNQAALDAGFWSVPHREHINVTFHYTREDAERLIARSHNLAAFKCAELIPLNA